MRAVSGWAAAWARFRPAAPALVDLGTGRRWSWADADRDVRGHAARLQRLGVGPGDRVAVLAHNRAETLLLLLAVAELGAVLLPLNWRLAAPEIAWQVAHASVRLLLVDALHADLAPAGLPVASIDDPPDDPAALRAAPGSRLEDPWMILYTSGSSGRPKGALLTHGQLLHNAVNTALACDLRADDCTLTFAPMFHTGGMNCLSTPLLHRGGCVVVAPGFDAGQALAAIAAHRVTHLMGVPTIYQMLAEHPAFPAADLSSVRDALCGGAALPVPLLVSYQERGIPLRQGFGLTEVGPNCFSTPPGRVMEKRGSVGQVIHHLEARLVRPDGGECAVGEPGELWLRGPVVCAGYLDDPEATRRSLVDGWFRTGDLLAQDADGFFYVRGRIKEMFISGGENVYPAEVEAAILDHPDVALVAVVGAPDPKWGEVGHAFVQPRAGAAVDGAELASYLSGRLARFKIPKRFTVMGELPRIGSGKIDKARLAAEVRG